MSGDKLSLIALGLATGISVWFGIAIFEPRDFGQAASTRCIGHVTERGHLSLDTVAICSRLL
ncbi:MAG TPA: hypothetical protein V6C78_26805 [Crinalium sp.]|jgi:hypothetical protein